MHTQTWYTSSAGRIPSFTQCLPVGCFFPFFNQILIDLYPLSRDQLNKNISSSHPKYYLMECTHVLTLMMPDECSIDDDLYKQPFFQ